MTTQSGATSATAFFGVNLFGFSGEVRGDKFVVTCPDGRCETFDTAIGQKVEIDLADRNIIDEVKMDPVLALRLWYEGVITCEHIIAAKKSKTRAGQTVVLDGVTLLGCPFKVRISPAYTYVQ